MAKRTPATDNALFSELVAIMARLRGPSGCPWDREQDHRSLRPCLLEETYEVLEAIDRDDPDALRQELGDVLLQVIFHAQLAEEAGRFDIGEVVQGLRDKLRATGRSCRPPSPSSCWRLWTWRVRPMWMQSRPCESGSRS